MHCQFVHESDYNPLKFPQLLVFISFSSLWTLLRCVSLIGKILRSSSARRSRMSTVYVHPGSWLCAFSLFSNACSEFCVYICVCLQAVEDVVHGRNPSDIKDCIDLAALQLQEVVTVAVCLMNFVCHLFEAAGHTLNRFQACICVSVFLCRKKALSPKKRRTF